MHLKRQHKPSALIQGHSRSSRKSLRRPLSAVSEHFWRLLRSLGTSSPVDQAYFPLQPSPMEKVKTKLAVWSWAKEQGMDACEGRSTWIPLLDPDTPSTLHGTAKHSPVHDDRPFNPPNSQHTSVHRSPRPALTPEIGLSTGLSTPPSPMIRPRSPCHISEEDVDEEDEPLQPKTKSSPNRTPFKPHASTSDYLSIPIVTSRSTPTSPSEPQISLPRQLSNLGADETHFKAHRNSVDLLQLRQQNESKLNHNLMNSQDSMILARSKFNESYPKAVLDIRPAWSRADVLSRISDASPPPEVTDQGGMRSVEKQTQRKRQLDIYSAIEQRKVGCE